MNDERLNQIIADYLASEKSGNTPDRDQLLANHPDLADELKALFADHDKMHELAEPLQADDAVGSDPHAPTILKRSDKADAKTEPRDSTQTLGTKVRYFGDYELIEEIARGGMGVVYKARQTSLNRIVALRMILAGQLAGEEDVQRFHAEANLDYPGIVPIYQIGEHDGQLLVSRPAKTTSP